MNRLFLCLAVVALAASPLCADYDYNDPINNPTGQTWFPQPGDFPEPPPEEPLPFGTGPIDFPPLPPSGGENPYGPPELVFPPGWEKEWTEGWGDPAGNNPPVLTWHFEGMDPSCDTEVSEIKLLIPNNPENNPLKEIKWSIISDKGPKLNDDGYFASVNPGGAHGPFSVNYPPGSGSSIQLGGASSDGGNWYKYSGVIRIEPNPEFEEITFEFYECSNIAEITVETVCVPVPEPGTMALLLTSGIVMLVFGARRRK